MVSSCRCIRLVIYIYFWFCTCKYDNARVTIPTTSVLVVKIFLFNISLLFVTYLIKNMRVAIAIVKLVPDIYICFSIVKNYNTGAIVLVIGNFLSNIILAIYGIWNTKFAKQ